MSRSAPPEANCLPSWLNEAARGELGAVRAEGQGTDFLGVSLEGAEALAGAEVPQADGVIGAAGAQRAAVLAEAQAGDRLSVALEGGFLGAVEVEELGEA